MRSSDGFRKSSYSENGPQCVECRTTGPTVDVRDTRHPEVGHLRFPAWEWAAFLRDVDSL